MNRRSKFQFVGLVVALALTGSIDCAQAVEPVRPGPVPKLKLSTELLKDGQKSAVEDTASAPMLSMSESEILEQYVRKGLPIDSLHIPCLEWADLVKWARAAKDTAGTGTKSVRLHDCSIDTFRVTPPMISLGAYEFRFEGCTFNDVVELHGVSTRSRVSFANCGFESCEIVDSWFYGSVTIDSCVCNTELMFFNSQFEGGLAIVNTRAGRILMSKCQFRSPAKFNKVEVWGLPNFTSTTFKKGLVLSPVRLLDDDIAGTMFQDCEFAGTVDFANLDPLPAESGSWNIFDRYCFFAKDCSLRCPRGFPIHAVGIANLSRIWLQPADTTVFNREGMYHDLISFVNTHEKDVQKELHDDVLKRLNYHLFLENKYHSSGLDRLRLKFLDLVVHAGYRGGGHFFTIAGIIIGIFALIYFVFHRKNEELLVYAQYGVVKGDEKWADKLSLLKENEPGKPTIFFSYLWCSAVIFAHPKLTGAYFRLPPELRLWVLTEWLLGTALVALYLVYIASGYAFIHALIGM